jgi:hypothetical protein
VPRELCKQEASTPRVCNWGSCVSEGFTYERHQEVWNKRKTSTSLHWTVSHPGEVWECGISVGIATSLAGVYNIFHVSQLKKCLKAPMDVVLPEVAPLEVDLMYPDHWVKILDQMDRVT